MTVPVLESVSTTSLEDSGGWAIFGDKKDLYLENGCSISDGKRWLSSRVENQFASGFLWLLCPEAALSGPSPRTNGSIHRTPETRPQTIDCKCAQAYDVGSITVRDTMGHIAVFRGEIHSGVRTVRA